MNTQQKLIDLETSLGLLQRDVELQNEAILLLTRRCDDLVRTIALLTEKIDLLEQGQPAPENEKPPHY